ncbi:NAD(P)-binding protein [Wallemia mellicola]|nr:NAD(P)-binding protein [Wallemia mellicola]
MFKITRTARNALSSSQTVRMYRTSTVLHTPIPSALSHAPSAPNARGRLPGGQVIGNEAALQFVEGKRDAKRDIFSEFSLEGKCTVVSGGGGGLGLEIAQAVCEAGSVVHVFDMPPEPSSTFKAVQKYVKAFGSSLEYHQMDVTNQKAVFELCDKIGEKEGGIHGAVCAAAILETYDCLEYPSAEFEKTMQVNAGGVLYTSQGVARQMKKYNQAGSIAMIASMSGSITNRDQHWVGYNASKSAVLQMARSMAAELGPDDIRVNCISPGHFETPMTRKVFEQNPGLKEKWESGSPMQRLGIHHELRGVAVWLLSSASSFCQGCDVKISGGYETW